MQNREIASFWRFITSAIDRLIVCLDGLDQTELNWRPLPDANSLYVLAIHTLANTEENILGTLCGQAIKRNRPAEFMAQADSAETVRQQWQLLRERLQAALVELSPAELDREREHPRRGLLTGREVLLVVARHITEHMGQAQLTLDLLRAASLAQSSDGRA